MFFWRVDALTSAMIEHLPRVGAAIAEMARHLAHAPAPSHHLPEGVVATFEALPDISIDYGVMERAATVAVVPASFVWDDVGSWDAMSRLRPADEHGTVTSGDVLDMESRHSVLVNHGAEGHILAVYDVRDLVVVVTPDATLVCARERAQDVKHIVARLREMGRTDLL
jgi:mannose-1-phosphate guanylyltransferase